MDTLRKQGAVFRAPDIFPKALLEPGVYSQRVFTDRHLLFRRSWSVPRPLWRFKAKGGGIALPSVWSAFRGRWAAARLLRKALASSRAADQRPAAA